MHPAYRDQSRDRSIEDPTNLWLIHPVARALLPLAIRARISANAVSVMGLLFGAMAAVCYYHWPDWRLAALGFLFVLFWHVTDGLDGMIARATNTSSALGRFLDGIVDHSVFGFIYVAIALSVGTVEAWAIGLVATAFHAVQSSLYEGERARYHRRLKGEPAPPARAPSGNPLVRAYDAVATSLDRAAASFDQRLAYGGDGAELIERYRELAAPPMRLLSMLSANIRMIALFVACLAGNPLYLWWFEIVPLSLIALTGIVWHRRVERASAHRRAMPGEKEWG